MNAAHPGVTRRMRRITQSQARARMIERKEI